MNKRLLILLLLAGAVWAGYSFQTEKPVKDVATAVDWPRIAPEFLSAVESVSANGTFRLTKEPSGDWFVQGKDNATRLRADRQKAEALANFHNANAPRRVLLDVNASDPAKAAQYGLDNPAKTLALAGDRNATLRFGAKNPAGDAVYGVVTGSSNASGALLLLPASWLDQAAALDKYLDLRATDLHAQNITRLRVDNKADPFELERNGSADYRFLAPGSFRDFKVSSLDAERLLHEVAGLAGVALAPAPPPASAKPAVTLSVWRLGSDNATAIRLYPVADNPQQYLMQSDWQPAPVLLDRATLHRVTPDPFLLRDRRVLTLDQQQVHSQRLVNLSAGNLTAREVVAIRDPEAATRGGAGEGKHAWLRREDNASAQASPLQGMDMLLWRLTELVFEAEPSRNHPVTATPALLWDLLDANGTRLASLSFARDGTLPQGQCWLELDNATLYPVADEVLEQTLATVFPPRNATPAN